MDGSVKLPTIQQASPRGKKSKKKIPIGKVLQSDELVPTVSVRPIEEKQVVAYLRKKLSKRLEKRLEDYLQRAAISLDDEEVQKITTKLKKRKKAAGRFPRTTQSEDFTTRNEETGIKSQSVMSLPPIGVQEADDGAAHAAEPLAIPELPLPRPKKHAKPSRRISVPIKPATQPTEEFSPIRRARSAKSLESMHTVITSSSDTTVAPIETLQLPTKEMLKSMSDDDKRACILNGIFHVPYEIQSKDVLRVFVIADFLDSVTERTSLLKSINYLRDPLKHLGLHLDYVDLHWGLHEYYVNDHSLQGLILDNLRKVLQDPMGIVLMLVNGRYGSVVVPAEIAKDEYEAMRSRLVSDWTRYQRFLEQSKEQDETIAPAEEKKSDRKKRTFKQGATAVKAMLRSVNTWTNTTDAQDPSPLEQWYALDTTANPPIYRLRPISSVIPDFVNRRDYARLSQARNQWASASKALSALLMNGSRLAYPDGSRVEKYNKSLLHLEIETVLSTPSPKCHFVWSDRVITDIKNNLGIIRSREFIDIHPVRNDLDTTKQALLTTLRENLKVKIGYEKIHTRETEFDIVIGKSKDSAEPFGIESSKIILHYLKKRSVHCQPLSSTERFFRDVCQHVQFGIEIVSKFIGRDELITEVLDLRRKEEPRPILVVGASGAGKTALLAKIASIAQSDEQRVAPVVVIRFIGQTDTSKNLRKLLQSLSRQIWIAYGRDPSVLSDGDVRGAINDFTYSLSFASAKKPLLVIVDGLDQLSNEHLTYHFQWLPAEMPKFAHLLISTSSDKQEYKKVASTCFLLDFNERPLSSVDSTVIIRSQASLDRMVLSNEQVNQLISVSSTRRHPGALLSYYQVTNLLRPYRYWDEIRQQRTSTVLLQFYLAKVGYLLGDQLVRRAIGLLTCALHGVSDEEMLDLLSQDESVVREMQAFYPLQGVARVPCFAWYLLKHHLRPFLCRVWADQLCLTQWRWSELPSVVHQYYKQVRDQLATCHLLFTQYFKDGGSQPLYYLKAELLLPAATGQETRTLDRLVNYRRMSESLHHWMELRGLDSIKTDLLINFEYLLARILGFAYQDVMDAIHYALSLDPKDSDLRLIGDTLYLSARALKNDPYQLATQIVGRLQHVIKLDKPAAPGDPKKFPYCAPLLMQALQTSVPALIPSATCLNQPGDLLFDLLAGHSAPITALTTSYDGTRVITTSYDNTMKIWEIRTGKVLKTICDVGEKVTQLRSALKNDVVVSVESGTIRVWVVKTALCTLTVSESPDPACITLAEDGRLLIILYHGSRLMLTYNLENNELIKKAKVSPLEGELPGDTVLVSNNSLGDRVLIAFRCSSMARSQSCRTGQVIHRLRVPLAEQVISAQAVAISQDYYIVGGRQQYMSVQEIHSLLLYETRTGDFVRTVRGCVRDSIHEIVLNAVGSHALALCGSVETNSTDVAIWNLETENHKHLARHAGVFTMAASTDLRYFVTASSQNDNVCIWNISSKINEPAARQKRLTGIEELLPFGDRYVVAKTRNGPISVWNVSKSKCTGDQVRIAHGLTDQHDVVLVRDTSVVVLSDRGLVGDSHDTKGVFQSVSIYDLRERKYIRKVKDCLITLCPPREYRLLPDGLLLSVSDLRDCFIIWSVQHGQPLQRIRTNLSEKRRLLTNQLSVSLRQNNFVRRREGSALMPPWQRRNESMGERERRHEQEKREEQERVEALLREKDNPIDQYVLSADERIIIASYFAHHMCVFSLESRSHVQTLENNDSILLLHTSALTPTGSYLVHTNYDERAKVPYLTVWDCMQGTVKKRLKNESNVACVAITTQPELCVVFGKTNNDLKIWRPLQRSSLRRLRGLSWLHFSEDSRIFLIENGRCAVVFAGDISVWDLERAVVLAVFSPDTRIQCCTSAMDGQLIVLGMKDRTTVVTLRVRGLGVNEIDNNKGENLFGESPDSSDFEEEDQYS